MPTMKMREAVGVFEDEKALRNAADDLMISGFDRSDLSVLAGRGAIVDKLGEMYDEVADIEDDPIVPTHAYVGSDSVTEGGTALVAVMFFIGAVAAAGPVLAGGGTTFAAIVAAVVGGLVGILIGGAITGALRSRYRRNLQDQLDHGGIPLWVRTPDAAREYQACDILGRAGAKDVHVHDRPRVEETDVVYGYLDRISGIPKPKPSRRVIIH